jgi:hypothetical protein
MRFGLIRDNEKCFSRQVACRILGPRELVPNFHKMVQAA